MVRTLFLYWNKDVHRAIEMHAKERCSTRSFLEWVWPKFHSWSGYYQNFWPRSSILACALKCRHAAARRRNMRHNYFSQDATTFISRNQNLFSHVVLAKLFSQRFRESSENDPATLLPFHLHPNFQFSSPVTVVLRKVVISIETSTVSEAFGSVTVNYG